MCACRNELQKAMNEGADGRTDGAPEIAVKDTTDVEMGGASGSGAVSSGNASNAFAM